MEIMWNNNNGNPLQGCSHVPSRGHSNAGEGLFRSLELLEFIRMLMDDPLSGFVLAFC